MACRQACPYNTLTGCRVKELDGICPLTNMNPGTKRPLTNADRIRAMTDEELAVILNAFSAYFDECTRSSSEIDCNDCELNEICSLQGGKALEWLQLPVKED